MNAVRKTLFAAALLFVALSGKAQGLSLGARGGIAYWLEEWPNHSFHTLEGDHLPFVPEVFLRFTAKKRWAFETSFGMTHHTVSVHYTDIFDAPYRSETDETTMRNLEWSLSAQYDLIAGLRKRCKILRAFHSFLGLTINFIQVKERTDVYPEDFLRGRGYVPPYSYQDERTLEFWAGISHTLTWDFNKRLSLLSVFDFRVRPAMVCSSNPIVAYLNPAIRLGTSLGVAYRF